MVPCAEMVRFGKNGSDVTAGAVGLRAPTLAATMCWFAGTTAGKTGTLGLRRAHSACPMRKRPDPRVSVQ